MKSKKPTLALGFLLVFNGQSRGRTAPLLFELQSLISSMFALSNMTIKSKRLSNLIMQCLDFRYSVTFVISRMAAQVH
jgi:hypothetical protein